MIPSSSHRRAGDGSWFRHPRVTPFLVPILLVSLAARGAAQDWTTFSPGTLDGFSFVHAHLPDGRYLFGTAGSVSVQTDFLLPGFLAVANPDNREFDPSFLAVRSATEALIGGGGFFAPSELFPFDPSTPDTPVAAGLTSLQNYDAAFWRHPTSGREGWLVAGSNGAGGSHNLSFVAADGSVTGAVTEPLSAFSGGMAVSGSGDVVVALADLDPAIDNQILTFTADQIDAAVAAILASSPDPVPKSAAGNPFGADASGAVAVDGLGRFWFGGYQINHLQLFDPATGVQRRVKPDHPPLPGASGPPTYAPRTFRRDEQDHVSFLANDSFYTPGSALLLGHRTADGIVARSVQFATAEGPTVWEDAGTVLVRVTVTPPPTAPLTVTVSASGQATPSLDFTVPDEITFAAGEHEKDLAVTILDDSVAGEGLETVIITLGDPSPPSQAGLGATGSERFTFRIRDNEIRPLIEPNQGFGMLAVGRSFAHPVLTSGPAATRWAASGLPPGLRIDSRTGIISGTPTAAGTYERVVLVARNRFGATASVVFLLQVSPLPLPAVGRFTGSLDRTGAETEGNGGRLDIATRPTGRWSGRIRIGRKQYSLRGFLDTSGADPAFTAGFLHRGTILTLNGFIDPDTGELGGGITGGSGLTGYRHAESIRSGTCHFFAAIPGGPAPEVPEGTGIGRIRFGRRSSATVAGWLADGSAFTSAGGIGPAGEVTVHQALYRVPGSFLAVLAVAEDLDQTVSGTGSWSKPAQLRGTYPAGWPLPLDLQAEGGRYRPVAGATLPLDADRTVVPNATLTVQDGGLDQFGANPREFGGEIVSSRLIRVPAPQRLSLNNASGAVGGLLTVTGPDGPVRARIRALLVPDMSTPEPFDALGHGFFLLTDPARITRSGLVLLEPNR